MTDIDNRGVVSLFFASVERPVRVNLRGDIHRCGPVCVDGAALCCSKKKHGTASALAVRRVGLGRGPTRSSANPFVVVQSTGFIAPDVNARKASGIVAYVTVGSSAYLTSREGDESDHDVVLISIDHRQEPESALNG